MATKEAEAFIAALGDYRLAITDRDDKALGWVVEKVDTFSHALSSDNPPLVQALKDFRGYLRTPHEALYGEGKVIEALDAYMASI